MRIVSVRDANQRFSRILSDVEKGETFLITKNGHTVAELRPRGDDARLDPEWRAAHRRLVDVLGSWPDRGARVGAITEDDKYGDTAG
jgi:antitoxin (DNA-binding transcriptional repressor) of toxin-antitoxin stability system